MPRPNNSAGFRVHHSLRLTIVANHKLRGEKRALKLTRTPADANGSTGPIKKLHNSSQVIFAMRLMKYWALYPGITSFFPSTDTNEKCASGRGEGYRGTWSISHSGAECINWNSTTLRGRRYTARKMDASSLGLGNHNYCR